MSIITLKKTEFQSEAPPSTTQAANFMHLYWDVIGFGIAFGSTLSFLPVFATRLGASGWQIGLLTAVPALVNTLFTLSAGQWLRNRSLGWAVTQAAFWQRLGFFMLIPLPLLLPAGLQIWAALLLTLLMAIPGTALAIGFNALLAATVPPEDRGRVVGWRNALLAATIMVAFLVSGWILDQLTFAWGYGLVFALGATGAILSTYHLSRIKVPEAPHFQMRPLRDRAQPGRGVGGLSDGLAHRTSLGARLWIGRRRRPLSGLKERISGRYWGVMAAFFLFHFGQMLPAALFPLFWVRQIHLSDGIIGWMSGAFYLTMLIASPFLQPLTRRLGSHRLTVVGAILLSIYPLLTALSYGPLLLFVASILGGLVWAILSGAMLNRLMEVIPEDDRSAHFALYNLVLNVATLSSTLLGPLLANVVGLREVLFIVFLLRIASGLALARWG